MIDQATISRIHDAAQIHEVVSDYVTLRKRGVNYIGLCPFHNEKTPSFSVNPARNIFKCFGCGKGGSPVTFVMEVEQLSYPEALKQLAKKYHIEVEEKELSPEELSQRTERESMLVLNDYARSRFADTLHNHPEGRAVGLAYFRERGFRDDTILKFQLGYALESPRDAFTQEALKKGYKKEFLVKTGLTIEGENSYVADRFRGRVLFPIHTVSGKVVAFGGRVLKSDAKTAKYLNSPESEIYHKSTELYGIYFAKQAIVRQDRCLLVEGYTDVISMHQSGIENVVSSSGTSLTQGQIRLIRRFTENVTVIYDGDSAGIKAAIRGIDLLLEEGLNIKVLLLPDGEDPDSFARKHNASDFIEFVERNSVDFIRFKTQLLLEDAGKDPIRRAALISDIVRSISVIPDGIVRSVYVRECSRLLEIEESALYDGINRQRKNKAPTNSPPAPLNPPSGGDFASTNDSVAQSSPLPEEGVGGGFEKEERELVRYLVRYGEQMLYVHTDPETGEETSVSVARYIIADLEADGLQIANPLYRLCLDEAKAQLDNAAWIAERHFAAHPNPNLNRLATDLLTDVYTLSKMHSRLNHKIEPENERLHELVPRAVNEFKNKFVVKRLKDAALEIRTAQESGDIGRVEELMREITNLNQIKNLLAKNLGERIIIRI